MMEKTHSELAVKNADPEEAKMNDDSKENETGAPTIEKSTGGESKSDPVEEKGSTAEERESAAERKGPAVKESGFAAEERGLTAEEKSLATDDGLSNTPYDDVFRTIINDARELVLPLLNEIFGDHYTGEEKIEFAQDTHMIQQSDQKMKRRITDSSFSVIGEERKRYLMEAMSTPDNSFQVRFYEYASQAALDEREMDGSLMKVRIPNCAVLFLRSTKNTPDEMKVRIETEDGDVTFTVHVVKVQRYTVRDIFEKKLYFLIPFHIFSHEKHFGVYEENEGKREALKSEYVTIMNQLEQLEMAGGISAYARSLLVSMSRVVLRHIAAKYKKVREEMEEIMGGRILDYEAKRIRMEVVEEYETQLVKLDEERKKSDAKLAEEKKKSQAKWMEDMAKTVRNLMETIGLTREEAMSAMKMSESDRKVIAPLV